MKELQSILLACREIALSGAPAALATVMKTEGSAYRRPGARLLVREDGTRVGSISGGCLEADVAERAKQTMATGKSQIVRYDARGANGDLIFEAGCDGAIVILIEPIERAAPSLEYWGECIAARRTGALATVFCVDGMQDSYLGARLMINGEQTVTEIRDSEFVQAIHRDAHTAMTDGKRRSGVYETKNRTWEVLIEPIAPPIALIICGAAPGAVPLARLGAQMGWRVAIADTHSIVDAESLAGIEIVTAPRERLLQSLTPDARTAVVVMTHNYEWDLTLLTRLLPSPARYIGLLGSRKRAQRVWSDLHDARLLLTTEQRERFHSPAGLDIGSETPEEIALSIIAEIQAAMSDRAGGALRDRRAPIHSFETAPVNSRPEIPFSPIHSCAR